MGLRLGEWNIEDEGGLLSRISYEQLSTWVAYNNLDPFTSERDDWRAAQTTAAIYNVNITSKGDKVSAKDFMLGSIEERVERESRSQDMNVEAARAAWDKYMRHLETIAKPVGSRDTFKG